jgi:hypothetical protein
VLSVVGVVVVGNLLYGSVFAPHLITKLGSWGAARTAVPGRAESAQVIVTQVSARVQKLLPACAMQIKNSPSGPCAT